MSSHIWHSLSAPCTNRTPTRADCSSQTLPMLVVSALLLSRLFDRLSRKRPSVDLCRNRGLAQPAPPCQGGDGDPHRHGRKEQSPTIHGILLWHSRTSRKATPSLQRQRMVCCNFWRPPMSDNFASVSGGVWGSISGNLNHSKCQKQHTHILIDISLLSSIEHS